MRRTERIGAAGTLPLEDSRVKEEIKRIHEYVWARYVDGSDHYDHSVEEEEAIRTLDSYYSEIGNRNSPDQVYLGILLFERAFEQPDEQQELFERARKIFEFYRRVTGEDDWPAVEERLEDIYAFLGEPESEPVPEPEPAPERVTEAKPEPVPEPEPEAEKAPEAGKVAVAETEAPEAAPAPETEEAEAEQPVEEVAEVAEEKKADEGEAKRRAGAELFIADLDLVEGMQVVPSGTFLFGPDNREVFVDTFYIDRTPVTNAEYERFARETGYRQPRYAEDERLNHPEQPVVGVSYADAQQYAKWAGKELPTEEQWERAARGPDGRPYPWGNDPPGASDAVFGLDPKEGAPGPVGQTLRNVSVFGVHDTCGNVWEWTSTKFGPRSEFMVVKGGSYNDPIEFLTLYRRLEAHPKDKCEAIGFRCVKNVPH